MSSRQRWLSVQVGGERHRIGRLWVPDGLHIWLGNRGVHLWLFGHPHHQFDRQEASRAS